MSELIASWEYILDKIGIGEESSYCPSMSQILDYSSKITICGSNDIGVVKEYYSNNQLVKLSDISYKSTGGGGGDQPTQKTYKITGNISFSESINNINWTLSSSSNIQLSSGSGGLSSNGYFEISYTGVSTPYYLEIIISSNDHNYINENRYTPLAFNSFNSSNVCNLGTITFESL